MTDIELDAEVLEARLFDALEDPDPSARSRAHRQATRDFELLFIILWPSLVGEVKSHRISRDDAEDLVSRAIWKLWLVLNARLEANPEAMTGQRVPSFELRRDVGFRHSARQFLGRPLKGIHTPGLIDSFRRAQAKSRGRALVEPDGDDDSNCGDRVLADENRRIRDALVVPTPDIPARIDAERRLAKVRERLVGAGVEVFVAVARAGLDLASRADLVAMVRRTMPERAGKIVARLRRQSTDYSGGPVPVELLARMLDLSIRSISRKQIEGVLKLRNLCAADAV